MKSLKINNLYSGGLITNYYCSSSCGHCLYACSPKWEKKFITKEVAGKIMTKMISLGCKSIHIGGGEPLLNIEKLIDVADAAQMTGMNIEYVETNSSWFKSEADAQEKLKLLMTHGINQLLVSISPFHNEYIPFFKVKSVLKVCQNSGMRVFPWVMDFYSEIDAFDDRITHSPEEYIEKYGNDYFMQIPYRYWTHFGGRAVKKYSKLLPLTALDLLLESEACREISDTSHFHIDLFQNYIPGLCSGLAIEAQDLGYELDESKYPYITMLYQKGIRSFLLYAREQYSFIPFDQYLNKCHLCNHIRLFLLNEKNIDSNELKPVEYYSNLETD